MDCIPHIKAPKHVFCKPLRVDSYVLRLNTIDRYKHKKIAALQSSSFHSPQAGCLDALQPQLHDALLHKHPHKYLIDADVLIEGMSQAAPPKHRASAWHSRLAEAAKSAKRQVGSDRPSVEKTMGNIQSIVHLWDRPSTWDESICRMCPVCGI